MKIKCIFKKVVAIALVSLITCFPITSNVTVNADDSEFVSSMIIEKINQSKSTSKENSFLPDFLVLGIAGCLSIGMAIFFNDKRVLKTSNCEGGID